MLGGGERETERDGGEREEGYLVIDLEAQEHGGSGFLGGLLAEDIPAVSADVIGVVSHLENQRLGWRQTYFVFVCCCFEIRSLYVALPGAGLKTHASITG